MYVILLRFSDNKAAAPEHMHGHNDWIKRGLDDGVFLLVASLKPGLGGAILAHNETPDALAARVDADPFVAENVVAAEILDIAAAKTDPRLDFLLD